MPQLLGRLLKTRRLATTALLLLVIAAVAAIPIFVTDSYLLYVANLILIYAILALGLDLLVGYAGQVSLGHGAFYGIGAYTAAILSTTMGLSFWITTPLAILCSGVIGYVVGLIGLRLKEDYLVMATVAFGTILWLIFLNWQDVTRGAMGISGIAPPPSIDFGFLRMQFDTYQGYFYLLILFVILAVGISWLLMNSGFGRACKTIRDDELAAQAIGVPVLRVKVAVFSLSAAYCGAGGALYAHFIHVVSPESFTFSTSVSILTMVMIGGKGSIFGALLGAGILTVVSEALRAVPELRMTIYGFVLILLVLFFPHGIVGILRMLITSITGRRKRRTGESSIPGKVGGGLVS